MLRPYPRTGATRNVPGRLVGHLEHLVDGPPLGVAVAHPEARRAALEPVAAQGVGIGDVLRRRSPRRSTLHPPPGIEKSWSRASAVARFPAQARSPSVKASYTTSAVGSGSSGPDDTHRPGPPWMAARSWWWWGGGGGRRCRGGGGRLGGGRRPPWSWWSPCWWSSSSSFRNRSASPSATTSATRPPRIQGASRGRRGWFVGGRRRVHRRWPAGRRGHRHRGVGDRCVDLRWLVEGIVVGHRLHRIRGWLSRVHDVSRLRTDRRRRRGADRGDLQGLCRARRAAGRSSRGSPTCWRASRGSASCTSSTSCRCRPTPSSPTALAPRRFAS